MNGAHQAVNNPHVTRIPAAVPPGVARWSRHIQPATSPAPKKTTNPTFVIQANRRGFRSSLFRIVSISRTA
jgi:hypothetical protein